MLYTAIGFFSLAAIFGLILLPYILRDKETPKSLALLHGLLAATALVLTIYYTVKHRPGPVESAVLFTIAALGGLVVFGRDITNKSIPKWLAVIHGLIAITGFVFLLIFAFSK
jgi:RsiW-degrading membrane proteinase PrsW (M82 family)